MRIPGFAAEASVYQPSGQYCAAMIAGFALPNGVAIPQQMGLEPISHFFCFPKVCFPGGVQTCCSSTPFGGIHCSTNQCPPPPPPPQCQGKSGCDLFRCECHSTDGILGPPRPGFPCGTCIHS